MTSRVVVVALALGALACGDPDTNDRRGYTKAPLENPGLLIGGEYASEMAGMNRPNLPRPNTEFDPAASGADGDGDGEQEVTLAPGVTQEQFDEGRALFSGQGACHACHGPNGSGSQLGPSLADAEWLHVSGPDVAEIANIIQIGVSQPVEAPGPMPPMGGASLTDEQVQALAGYVASLGQS